jgi:hypothetical protein
MHLRPTHPLPISVTIALLAVRAMVPLVVVVGVAALLP